MTVLYAKVQVRRDTAANWASTNPILAEGESGLTTDTLVEKIGDGVRAWNDLPSRPSLEQLTDVQNAAETAASDAEQRLTATVTAQAETEIARDETQTLRDQTYGYKEDVASAVVYQDLASIAESKASTAVDVFVYDTSRDSDGGAWRNRCQGTSWYNEPLNTATRGSRQEFPAVAVIVAETGKVTIYDGDDPSLPMWMVFNIISNGLIRVSSSGRSLCAMNGMVAWAAPDAAEGLTVCDFIADNGKRYRTPTTAGVGNSVLAYPAGLASRSAAYSGGFIPKGDSQQIVSAIVNDVAMTVLPDAPVDPATGLQVPTIYAFTAGGVSRIAHDGTVSSTSSTAVLEGGIFGGRVWCSVAIAGTTYFGSLPLERTLPAGGSLNAAFYWSAGRTNTYDLFVAGVAPSLDDGTFGLSTGLHQFTYNASNNAASILAITTAAYSTGWLPGDIRGAFLASTDQTDLTDGQTDDDRSVNANGLIVNGTITRTPVATGAELVAYSGFSATNYLSQPYNSALDFGTGDFFITGWIKHNGTNATRCILCRGAAINSDEFSVYIVPTTNALRVRTKNNAYSVDTNAAIPTNAWTYFAVVRRSGIREIYLNGKLNRSDPNTEVVSTTTALTIGIESYSTIYPATGVTLDLVRISATAPTADQIAKIYRDELPLFQENAQCTLYGTSDAVTALAHDPVTDLLHVGTSAGRSVFDGLARIDNTTDPVGTTISAVGGMIVED